MLKLSRWSGQAQAQAAAATPAPAPTLAKSIGRSSLHQFGNLSGPSAFVDFGPASSMPQCLLLSALHKS